MKIIHFSLAATLALSACGATETTTSNTRKNFGNIPSGTEFTYNNSTNQYTGVVNGETLTFDLFDGEIDATIAAYELFVSSDEGHYITVSRTPSGTGYALFLASADGPIEDSPELELLGTQIGRWSDPTLPTGGTITYTGDYISLGAGAERLAATGDASLTANFVNGEINGTVTNRQADVGQDSGLQLADIQLELTDISASGSFQGVAAGGGMLASGSVISGSYSGLLTGANAQEAVVGVTIGHLNNGALVYERGLIVAD